METWANIKTDEGKKTIIIENAEKMLSSVRNALLKILEEPPADCIFILTSSNKNAILPTVLSRVRAYNFKLRNSDEQKQVISRVFHTPEFQGNVSDYLLTFLPVSPDVIKQQAKIFYSGIINREIVNMEAIVKNCDSFKPKKILQLFLKDLIDFQKNLLKTPAGCQVSACACDKIRICYDNINSYNQNVRAALETLFRDLSALNVRNELIISKTGLA
jgi:DNA polymerase-3 subunit gamma/tau